MENWGKRGHPFKMWPNHSIKGILRYTQDRPFDASILLSIDPEPIDIAQGRWVDSLRAADLGRLGTVESQSISQNHH